MTSRSPPSGGVSVALGGVFAIACGIGIGRFIYTPILPPMIEALSLSKANAGLIAAANFAGYFVGAIWAAAARLPGSRRTWLLGAMAASAASTAGMGLVVDMASFLALCFAGGVASALVMILASALVLEALGRAGRASLASLFFAGGGIGITTSAVGVSLLVLAGQDWATLWLTGGALSLMAIAAVAWLIPDQPGPSSVQAAGIDQRRRATGQISDKMLRLAGACILFGCGYVITATFVVTIVRGTPAIRPLEPTIWIIVGLAATPSVALWSWLARRFDTDLPLPISSTWN